MSGDYESILGSVIVLGHMYPLFRGCWSLPDQLLCIDALLAV